MLSLISDRFLKRFFGNRLQQCRVNPSSEAGSPLEKEGDKPTEPGCLPGEDSVEQEATLENKNAVFPENYISKTAPGEYWLR